MNMHTLKKLETPMKTKEEFKKTGDKSLMQY